MTTYPGMCANQDNNDMHNDVNVDNIMKEFTLQQQKHFFMIALILSLHIPYIYLFDVVVEIFSPLKNKTKCCSINFYICTTEKKKQIYSNLKKYILLQKVEADSTFWVTKTL